jgi:hypothetical protein
MNARNSEMRIVNHKNANQNIQNKAKNKIPRTLAQMQPFNHNL